MKTHILPIILSAIAVFSGCDNLEEHPYASKIHGTTDVIAKNVAKVEQSGLKLPIKFGFVTDTQGSYNELEEAVESLKKRGDLSFIIHGGDMTDFGLPKEFVWCRDLMQKTGLPYLPVLGNHDCLGNGENTYRYIFGDLNYSFNVGPVHFVMLNTIALEYDYSRPVPDFGFMTSDYEAVDSINAAHPDSITHTIAVMHSRPFDSQFNNNVADAFNYYLEHYPGMKSPEGETSTHGFCLCGHNHLYQVEDLFDNGIVYWQCADLGKRQYFVVTVTEEGYEVETIDF